MCWAYCMFLDKQQPDRVEKNQETSLVPVVVWPPRRQAGGDQRGLSIWAHVEPTAAPQANYRSLPMVTSFNSRI